MLSKRWRTSRPDPADASEASAVLAEARSAILLREGQRAHALATTAHGLSQNSPQRHALCHLHLSAAYLVQGRMGGTLGELRLGALAPIASLVRRASGFAPGQPNPAGILKTWRARRR